MRSASRELLWTFVLALMFFAIEVTWLFDERIVVPVQGAKPADWNPNAFWHASWGASGVHKGIDIFARRGTPALAAASGLVVWQGYLELGGNTLTILDTKMRLHYYAHLDSVRLNAGQWAVQGRVVGTVGNTGNARTRPIHLHYSMMSLIPFASRYREGKEGWKLMFYLNPADYLH